MEIISRYLLLLLVSLVIGSASYAQVPKWSGYKVGSNVLAPISIDIQKRTKDFQSLGISMQFLPFNLNILTLDVYLWEQSQGFQSRTFNTAVYYKYPLSDKNAFERFISPYLKFNYLEAHKAQSENQPSSYNDIYRLSVGTTIGYGRTSEHTCSEFFIGLGYYFWIRESLPYIRPELIKQARWDLRLGLIYSLEIQE